MVCGEVEGMDTAGRGGKAGKFGKGGRAGIFGRGGRPRILGTWRAADDVSMLEKQIAMKKTKMM